MQSLQDSILETEYAILGMMLYSYHEVKDHITALVPEDFSNETLGSAFGNIINFIKSGAQTVDLLIVPKIIDGRDYTSVYTRAVGTFSTTANVGAYVSELKKASADRRIKSWLLKTVKSAEEVNLNDLQLLIDRERSGSYVRSWVDKSRSQLDRFIDNIAKPAPRINTGFTSIDSLTGGLRIPSVMIIGAYPSVGKTAFALNIVTKHIGAGDRPAVFFSLEMSSEMIYERLISSARKIPYNVFSTRKFTQEQEKEIRREGERLRKTHLHVFDDVYDIEGQSSVIANIKPTLVVVDYLQKVRTAKRTDSRRTEIDYISGLYKQIANHNQCVVLLLSQISRLDRDKPTMSSLKESGALEADGDYIGLLHRPYVIKKDDPSITPEETYLLLDKNKFGRTGRVDMRFDVEYQRFYELEKGSGQSKHKWYQPVLIPDEDLPFL